MHQYNYRNVSLDDKHKNSKLKLYKEILQGKLTTKTATTLMREMFEQLPLKESSELLTALSLIASENCLTFLGVLEQSEFEKQRHILTG